MEKKILALILTNPKEYLAHQVGYSYCRYRSPLDRPPKCYVNDQSHRGLDRFAIDFMASEGDIVHAPHQGTIVYVNQNYIGYSHNPADGDKVNTVVIRTARDEYVELKHLQSGSVNLRVGDFVNCGDEVGKVGLCGYYIADAGVEYPPHLHMSVQGGVITGIGSLPKKASLRAMFVGYDTHYGSDGSVTFVSRKK